MDTPIHAIPRSKGPPVRRAPLGGRATASLCWCAVFALLRWFTAPVTGADSVVVFNEINCHPRVGDTAGEWIELHNQMTVDVDLSAWRVAGEIEFAFVEGTLIPGRGYLVVARDPIAVRASTGAMNVVGPWRGRLNGAEGRLELRDRNDRLMDQVRYRDTGRWPLAPRGSGATLAKRDPQGASATPELWTSSVLLGGTPGRSNFPDTFAARRDVLVPLDGLWRFEASGRDLGDAWRTVDFDDGGWAGQNQARLLAYWPFDGNAAAARGSDGTMHGASPTTDRNGGLGGALTFDGAAQQWVQVDGGGGLDGAAAGTISLWVRWIGPQQADCCETFGAVLARQGNGLFSDNIVALDNPDPEAARVVWRQSGGPAPPLVVGGGVVGSRWHHVAVTFSAVSSALYLDGVLEGSAPGDPLHANGGVPLSLGAWIGDGTGYASASLDDVAVWDQPLAPDQVAELAAQTKTPLDFAGPETALYFAGDGRLLNQNELLRTELPLGPVTYYFRRAFALEEAPAQARLELDFAVADGAVFYINGTEVYRHNMPNGAVIYATRAIVGVSEAPLVREVELPAAAVGPGVNVLAVEVHQADTHTTGMVFGAALGAIISTETNQPSDFLEGDLVFNEIRGAGGMIDIELYNRGDQPVDSKGYLVRGPGAGPDAEVAVPEGTVAPGGFLVLPHAVFGFTAAPGDPWFLIKPGGRAIADAVATPEGVRARFPDGAGEWLVPDRPTLGASNTCTLRRDIVINEIMYHAPPTLETPSTPFAENPEQWIEICNCGSAAVDLAGWRLEEGVEFQFGPETILAPGAHLVVANAPAALQARWPGIAIIGPFTGRLSHRDDLLVLRDAAGNPADRVHYFDDGRWPRDADGGGASLELRNPEADNAVGEAWAASREGDRSSWRAYSYRGMAQASPVGPDGQWHEFVVGLLDRGEVLLDDLSVVESPDGAAVQLLQNGAFETGAAAWRILGNHRGEVIADPDQPGNRVLRLTASGPTEHMSNHAETTLKNNRDIVNGREYLVSFRAKWIRGSRQLHTRLYFNRLPRTTLLESTSRPGTPGAPNSTLVDNLGPTFCGLRHEPAVPAPGEPVTISVAIEDPDGLGAVSLHWRFDGGPWEAATMLPGPAGRGRHSAILPGAAAGRVLQFYVEAADRRGATATCPAAGAQSRALCQIDDGLASTNGLQNVRLIALGEDVDVLHDPLNVMSNEHVPATLISNEGEVYYDVGLRLKGSEHSRTVTPRLGFNVRFSGEQLFRGIHRTVAIDRSESTGYGQREMLLHQALNRCGDLPTKYHDLIHLVSPRSAYTGAAELQLARYSDVFLDDQYENGGLGTVFEYELVYQLMSTHNGSPEGIKVPAPDSVVGAPIRALGKEKEAYRWHFLIKNNEERDDYRPIIALCQAMSLSGAAFQTALPTVIDVDQWLRGSAFNALTGVGDSYGGDGSQHNVQFYARPGDGRILYFPHDLDAFFDAYRPIVPNEDLGRMLATPAWARTYYGHLIEIIERSYNEDYLRHWAEQFGRLLPSQNFAGHLAFVGQRAHFVSEQVKAQVPAVPFAIATNGGKGFAVDTNSLTLTGTAPLGVAAIAVNGVARLLTWTSTTAWTLRMPLQAGPNSLVLQGLDRHGIPVADALDTLAVTNTASGAPQSVAINEWLARNTGLGGVPDPIDGLYQDWFELFNPNTNCVRLDDYYLTDDLNQPTKWRIPENTLLGPRAFLLVWADGQTDQNGLSPTGDLHAPFQLDASGEEIGLFAPDGTPQSHVRFGPQFENLSQGCYPDGDSSRVVFMTTLTPGAANSLAEPLRLIGLAVSSTEVTVTWSTVPGRTYRLESCLRLESRDWSPVGPDLTADGLSLEASEPVGPAPQRFYRVARVD